MMRYAFFLFLFYSKYYFINYTEIAYNLQFIDLCIMLGCDYTGSIKGVGPKRAIELIKNHRSLDKIVENIDIKKYSIPENWNYKEARLLFQEPEIANAEDIQVIFYNNFQINFFSLHKPYILNMICFAS